MTMHSDVHHLDLETMSWLDEGKDQPKPYAMEVANHQLMAIESVPNYKMFCLTGKKGQNSYLNQVDVMDCGSMVWNTPATIGEPPIAREDTAMAYDPKTCKVLLFGGWSNRWLGDTWTLNVSPIIGPPYAVFNVTPDIGPVFGETEVTIHGMQFKEAEKIEVCFKTGKNEVISKGTFVDSTKITCLTPNFEDFGAVEVEVSNINNEGWTVNKMQFRYFRQHLGEELSRVWSRSQPRDCRKVRRGNSFPHPRQGHVQRQAYFRWRRVHRGGVEGGRSARAWGLSALWTRTTASTRCTTRSPLRGGIASTSDTTISASRKRSFHPRISVLHGLRGPLDVSARVGAAPVKRKWSQITSLSAEKVALWGGSDDPVGVLNTKSNGWTWETADATGQPAPRKDYGQTGAAGKMIVFGGTTLAGEESDELMTFTIDGDNASWKTIEGVKPYRPMKPRHVVLREEQEAAEEAAEAAAAAEAEAAAADEVEAAAEGEAEGEADASPAKVDKAPAEAEEPGTPPAEDAPVPVEEPEAPVEAPCGDSRGGSRRARGCRGGAYVN